MFDLWSLRELVPAYVIWAGAIGTAYLLPKSTIQQEEDPTFSRWLIDNFGFFGVLCGGMLFAFASGLIFGEPVRLNFAAELGIALAAAGALSNFVPRTWFVRLTRRRPPKA